jgi:general secretion pathway protein A
MVDRRMIDKAALEVFGPDSGRGFWARHTFLPMLLGAFGLSAIVLAAYLHFRPGVGSAPIAQAAPALPVPAASDASSAVSMAPKPAPGTPVELDAVWSGLAPDMELAWRELSRIWKFDPGSDEPCVAAEAQQLRCYRTSELTIPLLRQLDRPGILKLQKANEPAVYAVLTGLSGQRVTLQSGGAVHHVSLTSLARFWHGEFATYWQPPSGYIPDLREGTSSTVFGLLSNQLGVLEGRAPRSSEPKSLAMDSALAERVKAFQQGQGIKPDGHPGPMTFMQIEKAMGGVGPSLVTGSR